jgi:hypothetical protein
MKRFSTANDFALGVGGDSWRCVVLSALTSTPVVMRLTIEGSAEPTPASVPLTKRGFGDE